MPRGDGTGPMGTGPMTARRAGFCAEGTNAQGMLGGLGCKRGAGKMARGAGFQVQNRFMEQPSFDANIASGNEKELLNNQVNLLEQQLQQVKQRLVSIETKPE